VNQTSYQGQIRRARQGVCKRSTREARSTDDGNWGTVNMVSYLVPSDAEFRDGSFTAPRPPSPTKPMGVKGVGERVQCSPPCGEERDRDALAETAITDIDMAGRRTSGVWRALEGGAAMIRLRATTKPPSLYDTQSNAIGTRERRVLAGGHSLLPLRRLRV